MSSIDYYDINGEAFFADTVENIEAFMAGAPIRLLAPH